MILIVHPLSQSNKVGDSGGLVLYRCFFIMISYEIDVIA